MISLPSIDLDKDVKTLSALSEELNRSASIIEAYKKHPMISRVSPEAQSYLEIISKITSLVTEGNRLLSLMSKERPKVETHIDLDSLSKIPSHDKED